jgi:hypothetical protein
VTTPDTTSMLITRVVLERRLGLDGSEQFTAQFTDGNGDEPSLVESLGMLELAKASALMGDCDCDEDDD